jgi:hypothetical protein
MNPNQQSKLANVLSEITQLHPVLSEWGTKLRQKIAEREKTEPDERLKTSGTYWALVAYADALTRLRLIVEQNFQFVETLGVLAVTRYIFELAVWLRALAQDSRYGLTYCFQIMDKQIRYYEDYVKRMEHEIALLKRLGEEESAEIEATTKAIVSKPDTDSTKALVGLLQKIQSETDRKARRNFCMYADQAKTNGHSFQAFLIEKQILPKLHAQLDNCRRERAKRLLSVKDRAPIGTKWEEQEQSWRWKKQAAAVGMSDQFDFIYSFTSRLLHATPVSLTTNQKLLEPEEMHLFLEYIYVSILDIVDLAKQMLGEAKGDVTVH